MPNKIAEFNTTMGSFKVELYGDKVPLTVGNFVKLVDKGFYNKLIFHDGRNIFYTAMDERQ